MIVSFPTRSLPQKNARTQHTKPKKTRKHNFFYSVLKDIVSECRTMRPSGRRVSRDKTERMAWTGWILATAKWGSDGLDWLDSGWILELPDVPLSLLRPKKDDLAYYRRTSLALHWPVWKVWASAILSLDFCDITHLATEWQREGEKFIYGIKSTGKFCPTKSPQTLTENFIASKIMGYEMWQHFDF